VLQLSIKQCHGSHHSLNEHDIYKENVKANSMWWVGVNCTRHADSFSNYPALCLACSPFVEEEQLMLV